MLLKPQHPAVMTAQVVNIRGRDGGAMAEMGTDSLATSLRAGDGGSSRGLMALTGAMPSSGQAGLRMGGGWKGSGRKYQPPKVLTPQQISEAVLAYESGLSIQKIAKAMGVSRQSMWDILRRRTTMRDRLEALPRKEPTAIRQKRDATRKRYRLRAARITAAQMREVRARDESCLRCGAAGTDFDHILAVSLGGQTTMDNLQLLCHPCHIQKSKTDRSLARNGRPPRSGRGVFLVKICQSPESGGAWAPEPDPGSPSPSSTLWSDTDLPPSSSRTFRDSSPAMPAATLGGSSVRWSGSGTAWRGGSSTAAGSACPSAADGSSSSRCDAVITTLTDVLQPSAPQRYSLSGRAATGILRRAAKRGRALPPELEEALESLARSPSGTARASTPPQTTGGA